ncbi:DUF6308 family protein [Arthrobacter sp. zg-Y750]|uniref:DUF6308 family protein n=1 Tax=Arthrobacter sp. zg-Y750 TaxID=2894189 RepID=UPI001E3AA4E0|nr:DUF6308 family protein [Arthrobacter sp. zg-Y750]MCC9176668.1 DUF6308 family protein [Arthrobacter sp. zg-Y750]
MGNVVELPGILSEDRTGEAAKLLSRYYTEKVITGSIRTGARFDSWAGGGDAPAVANAVTSDDLLALAFLGVEVKGPAVVGLLDTHAAEITRLLEQIPTDVDMADVKPQDYERFYGEGSAAWELWKVIRGSKGARWKMGSTKTSKLLARKRPLLIPVWDSVVKKETQLKGSLTQWSDWHDLLTRDGGLVADRLDAIQQQANLPHPVSRLRAMDVVLWMHGTDGGLLEPAADEADDSDAA